MARPSYLPTDVLDRFDAADFATRASNDVWALGFQHQAQKDIESLAVPEPAPLPVVVSDRPEIHPLTTPQQMQQAWQNGNGGVQNTSSVDASGSPSAVPGSAVSSAPAGFSQPAGAQAMPSGGGGAFANNDERLAYVRQSAAAHGHDPETAARVAMSEGAGPAGSVGDQGTSFGALQAHVGGGQGDDFKAQTGLDPSDPANERALIDWQLSNLGQTGWTPFHGAAAAGIGPWQGVGTGRKPDVSAPSQPSAMPQGQSQYAPGSYTPNQINAATSEGLDYETALAVCGPAAAIAFARKTGRNPTMQEALGLAKQVGWTVDAGMAGPGSEQSLLHSMGVASRLVDGAPDWQSVAADVQRGNPVIISTPGHYFVAEQYDPTTGKFNFGQSTAILRAAKGQTWFTPDEMANLGMGAPRASLFMDSPTSPAPSVVAGQSQQPAQMNRLSLTQGDDQWPDAPSGATSPSPSTLSTSADSTPPTMYRQPLSTPTSGPDTLPSQMASSGSQPPTSTTPTFQDSQTEPANLPAPVSQDAATPPPTDAPPGVGASAAPGQPTPGAGAFQDDQTDSGWNPAGAAPGPQVPDMSGTSNRQNPTDYPADSSTVSPAQSGSPLKPVWDAAGNVIGAIHTGAQALGNAASGLYNNGPLNEGNAPQSVKDQVNAITADASGQTGIQGRQQGILDYIQQSQDENDQRAQRQAEIWQQADAWETQNGTPDRTFGLKAVNDPRWRAANPDLAAEYDEINRQQGLAVGQAVQSERPLQAADAAMQGSSIVPAIRGAIDNGIGAVRSIGSNLSAGAERAAAPGERALANALPGEGSLIHTPTPDGDPNAGLWFSKPDGTPFTPAEAQQAQDALAARGIQAHPSSDGTTIVIPAHDAPPGFVGHVSDVVKEAGYAPQEALTSYAGETAPAESAALAGDRPAGALASGDTAGAANGPALPAGAADSVAAADHAGSAGDANRGLGGEPSGPTTGGAPDSAQNAPAASGGAGQSGLQSAEPVAGGRAFENAVSSTAPSPGFTVGPALSAAANVAGRRGLVGAGVGGVSGAVTGYETAPDDATTGERLGRAAEFGVGGAAAGATLAVGGTLAGGQLIDSLISSGKLDPRVLATHPQVADRVKALFALAAEGLPDDAPVPVPAMASAIASFSAKTQRELASLLYEPVTAGQVRQIVGDAGSPGVAQTVKEMVTDAITGLGNRARRGRELAADAATVKGIPQSWQDAAAGRVGESASTLATDYGPAARVNPETQPNLTNFVNEVADKLGVPRPGIYVAPSLSVNASATADAGAPALVLTRGILKANLTDDEMAAILTHELAHTAQPQQQSTVGRAFGAVKDALGNVMGNGQRDMANALPGGGQPPQLPPVNPPPAVQQAVQAGQAQQAATGRTGLDWLQYWGRQWGGAISHASLLGPSAFIAKGTGDLAQAIIAGPRQATVALARGAPEEFPQFLAGSFDAFNGLGAKLMDTLAARGQYANPNSLSGQLTDPVGHAFATALEVGARAGISVPTTFFHEIALGGATQLRAAQAATDAVRAGHISQSDWQPMISAIMADAQQARAGGTPHMAITQSVMDSAEAYAKKQTFTNEVGKFGQFVKSAASLQVWGPDRNKPIPIVSNFLLPYFNVPWNLKATLVEHSPVGLGQGLYDVSRGRGTQIGNTEKLFNGILGTTVLGGVGVLATNGLVTGKGPSDPDQLQALKNTGWQPYSTLVHGVYVPNKLVWQIASPVADMAGDTHDAIAFRHPGSPVASVPVAQDAAQRIGADLMNDSFFKPLADALSLVNPGSNASATTKLARFAASQVDRFAVPYASTGRAVGAAIDPDVRSADRGPNAPFSDQFVQNARLGIGNRQGFSSLGEGPVPATQDRYGRTVPNNQNGPLGSLFRASPQRADPLNSFYSGYSHNLGPSPYNIQVSGESIPLTPEQQRTWEQYRGQQLDQARQALQNDRSWQTATPDQRDAIIARQFTLANESATGRIKADIGTARLTQMVIDAKRQKVGVGAP